MAGWIAGSMGCPGRCLGYKWFGLFGLASCGGTLPRSELIRRLALSLVGKAVALVSVLSTALRGSTE